jgi:hypothetical protein
VRRSFHERIARAELSAAAKKVFTLPMTMEDYRTGGTPWFVAIDPDGVVLQDGFVIDADRFTRTLGESGPAAP